MIDIEGSPPDYFPVAWRICSRHFLSRLRIGVGQHREWQCPTGLVVRVSARGRLVPAPSEAAGVNAVTDHYVRRPRLLDLLDAAVDRA